MRAYYINVASRTDRRDAMEARLLAVGVSAQRIDAVTDSDVRPEQRARYCDPTARRWTSVRELTCSLSHIKAMLAFLATDEEHAVIFEDDVLLSSALAQFLDEFERSPHGVDLLRLETDNSRLRVPPAAERST
jgi:glycosyl transferase family 25